MMTRCYNTNAPQYQGYGSRGITVCDRWNDFRNFLADMGPKPTPHHSIEREKVNGNYEPGNCVWATNTAQCRNKTNSRKYTHNGKTLILRDWSILTGINKGTLYDRINKQQMTLEQALTTPFRKYFAKPNPYPRRKA
jgi:hypothetical protein